MNKTEATTLVTMLVTFFPGAYFDAGNAAAYEAAIADLDARETHEAIAGLVQTSERLPSVAAIRAEVMRIRRNAREQSAAQALSLPDFTGPSPRAWGETLGKMLEDSARWQRMTEKFCRDRGLPMPKDPGQQFIDIARDGASGKDVSQRLRREVLNDQDEQERRYP